MIIQTLAWLALAFAAVQLTIFLVIIGRGLWTHSIRPRLIASEEIDRVAADIIARYPDPEAEAFARHEQAWYRSEGAKQVYWYRVRKAVRRKLSATG